MARSALRVLREEEAPAYDAELGTATTDNPLQQHGYVRCYREIIAECGAVAACLYGVLEDLAQLGERTGRGCVPSHGHLGELIGCTDRSVRTHLNALRRHGWVTWRTEVGGVNHYALHPGKYFRPPRKNLPTPPENISDNLTTLANKNDLAESPLSPPKGKRATAMTPDWQPTGELREWAYEHGFTEFEVNREIPKFVDHHLNGQPKKDWAAAFRLWMRRSREYGTRASPSMTTRQKFDADLQQMYAEGLREHERNGDVAGPVAGALPDGKDVGRGRQAHYARLADEPI